MEGEKCKECYFPVLNIMYVTYLYLSLHLDISGLIRSLSVFVKRNGLFLTQLFVILLWVFSYGCMKRGIACGTIVKVLLSYIVK